MLGPVGGSLPEIRGAEFKLDVGLYRLDQQVACQRIGNTIDAKPSISEMYASAKSFAKSLVTVQRFAPVYA